MIVTFDLNYHFYISAFVFQKHLLQLFLFLQVNTKWKNFYRLSISDTDRFEYLFSTSNVLALTSFSECRSTSPAHCIERKKSLNLSFICSTSSFRGFSQRSLACDRNQNHYAHISHSIRSQVIDCTIKNPGGTIAVKLYL